MDLPWLMCRYVNHTAKVSSTSSSRSLNCFRIFFTGNRSIFAAAASSAAAAAKKRECQLLLKSGALEADSWCHNVMFPTAALDSAASEFLISQCHISDIKKVSAALMWKQIYKQSWYLKVIFIVCFSCFLVWHYSKKDVTMSILELQKNKKVSCFSVWCVSKILKLNRFQWINLQHFTEVLQNHHTAMHDLQENFI